VARAVSAGRVVQLLAQSLQSRSKHRAGHRSAVGRAGLKMRIISKERTTLTSRLE
jgi:hypothetical protein